MKKILLATSALVATAGIAAAEVSISGNAEMGVVAGERYGDTSQFYTSSDIDFKLRGEADNGLTFGADFDLDEASALSEKTAVFIAFGAAKLTMGDTDGAFDWALSEVALAGGSIDDSETEHPGYNGNSGFDGTLDGQIARAEYGFGDFSAAFSAEIDDAGVRDAVYGIGFKYSGDLGGTTLNVGIGYQQRDKEATVAKVAAVLEDDGTITAAVAATTKAQHSELIGLSLGAELASGIALGMNYSEKSGNSALENETHTGFGIGYEMNALAIGLNYGVYDNYKGVKDDEASGFGLAVAYDLGGGLAVQFGAGVGETKDASAGTTTDFDSYSLGLAMKF